MSVFLGVATILLNGGDYKLFLAKAELICLVMNLVMYHNCRKYHLM